jgi:hypothetical protein
MAPTHHCRLFETNRAGDALRGRLLLMQARTTRLLLAANDINEETYLDTEVPDCVACYREMLVELASQCVTTSTILYGDKAASMEELQSSLSFTLKMASENDGDACS